MLAKIKASPQSPAPINLHTPFGHTLHIPTGFCVETFCRRVKTVVGAVETEMLYHGWHMIGTFEKKVSGNEWLWQEVPMSRGEGMIEHVALDTNTSAVVEPVTGLYDFRNRWYSPESGSWLSRDPLGYVDSENLYQGFGGNTLTGTDVFGLQSAAGGMGAGYTSFPAPPGGEIGMDRYRDEPGSNQEGPTCKERYHSLINRGNGIINDYATALAEIESGKWSKALKAAAKGVWDGVPSGAMGNEVVKKAGKIAGSKAIAAGVSMKAAGAAGAVAGGVIGFYYGATSYKKAKVAAKEHFNTLMQIRVCDHLDAFAAGCPRWRKAMNITFTGQCGRH